MIRELRLSVNFQRASDLRTVPCVLRKTAFLVAQRCRNLDGGSYAITSRSLTAGSLLRKPNFFKATLRLAGRRHFAIRPILYRK